MTIHPAAQAFDSAADSYERGRPDYPPEVLNILREETYLAEQTRVVDLAAGTGKFTRSLAESGAHITAVEPVSGMRAKLQESLPGLEVVDGTAENIPLPDASADLVTVAQAFHWFDGEAALREIHRVLRAGGALALVWNRRDLAQPLQRAIQDLVQPYRGNAPAHRSDEWRAAFRETPLFTPLRERRVPHRQEVDPAGLVDRVVSISFIAALPDEERVEVGRRARALAEGYPPTVSLAYNTEVFWCFSRASR